LGQVTWDTDALHVLSVTSNPLKSLAINVCESAYLLLVVKSMDVVSE